MQSYSQECNNHRADVMLFQRYINVKRDDGIFLELGACDGVYLSNTLALEKYLNYRGVLIEPGLSHYNELIQNRPNCKTYNCIVSTKEGSIDYIGDGTGVGGVMHILEHVAQESGKRWIEGWNLDRNKITKVPSRKLSDILHEANIKYIDFWSLDVEGSELEVLKTMDWSIPVYIICLEVSAWGDKGQRDVQKCRTILKSKGFTSDGIRYGLDEWWINEKYFRKDLLYRK